MKRWMMIISGGIVLFCLAMILLTSPQKTGEEEPNQVNLKWMVYGDRYQEADLIQARFNQALQEYYPNISVELEIVPKAEYQRKWDMKMADNEILDVAWVGNDVINFTEEVKKGSLMALDYLLNTSGKDLKASIPMELWNKQQRDGSTYAIPVMGALYRKNYVLTVNKSLMERYGDFEEIIRVNQGHKYTEKECFDVMEPFLAKTKRNNALGKGVSYQTLCTIADKGTEGIYGLDSPFVIRIFDEKPTVYNKYELESYRACFETMADWYEKGYIREDVAYLLDPTAEDGKKSGNILFVEEYGECGTVYDSRATEYEALRGELDGYRYISHESCRNCLVIPKTARHPQEAMQVINLLNAEEGKELVRLLANGTEKEQYVRISRDSDVIARMTDDSRNYRYSLSAVNFGSVFQNYELRQGEFDKLREYNENALTSPLEGFELDTRMFAIEMAKVELIVKKYKEELCQGTAKDWEETYRIFLKEMEEAGSEKIIEEVQKQVDVYLGA